MPFTAETAEHFDGLYQFLSRKYGISETRWQLSDREFLIFAVEDVDHLLDELIAAGPGDERVKDEQLPYWAEIWPSSLALAKFVLEVAAIQPKNTVLEIGCGLGIAGLSAAFSGASVLLTDYQEDALRFSELNWLANLGVSPGTRLMDWRSPDIKQKFDVILASDVVYEKRFFWPLLNTFEELLTEDGHVYLSEPNRSVAKNFFKILKDQNFRFQKKSISVNFREKETAVSVFDIWRAGKAKS